MSVRWYRVCALWEQVLPSSAQWLAAWRSGARLAGAVALSVGGVCSPSWADTALASAQAQLAQGQAQQAFAALDALEADRAGDPAFDELMARAAFAAGHFSRSVMAWERVVSVQPDREEAQHELLRAFYAVGDRRGAMALSAQVRARGIPVDAALSIDQIMVSYDRPEYAGGSSIKGHVELGLGRDSNANAGPREALFHSGNPAVVPWTLDPSAVAMRADFVAAALSLRGRLVMDSRWSLIGNVSLLGRDHGGSAGAWDSSQLDATGGVAWRLERHEWMLSAQGGYYGLDGRRLRSLGGVVGEWIFRPDGFRQWGSFVQVVDLRYPEQPLRDVRRTVAGTTYSQVLRSASIWYAGLYGGQEAARGAGSGQWAYRLWGARAGAQWPLGPQWAVFVNADVERRRYSAEDAFFAAHRTDEQLRGVLGLSWTPSPGWRVTPQWEVTRNDSTLPVHTYRRQALSLWVRREF